MRVLVTGAAGFIGSHLCERLVARGDSVLALDNFDSFYPREIKEGNLTDLVRSDHFRFREGDVRSRRDLEQLLAGADGPVDTVVHLAALAGVRPSLSDAPRFYDVNVVGTSVVHDVCRRAGIRKVVFASSSSVYGAGSAVPFVETDPCAQPLSPYAASKRAGELIGWNEHSLHGTNVTSLRFFTVYGPRQRPDLAIHKFTSLIARGLPIELYGDGGTARDYTYIDDILDGVVAAIDQLEADRRPHCRVYNLSGADLTTLASLVEMIGATLGLAPRVVHLLEQAGDMRVTMADLALSHRELGYLPRTDLKEGLARFVRWWRAREGQPEAASVRL
jgi:UDP-glucuronate 4-epimerase